MRYIATFCLGFMLLGSTANAQTLFSYGKHKVNTKDFVKVYEKNNNQQPGNQTSVSDYVTLYSLYRMKVQEAEDMKLDTSATVIRELEGYKEQLTQSLLTDKEVTSKLVEEAYERMKKDIRVAHLFISVKSGEDEQKSKKLIDSLYREIQNAKVDFVDMVKKFSDDQTTIAQDGEIGYITVLQTPYAFETVAYNTSKGRISRPFRTSFGFHILKVLDIRSNQGQVEVAQIMIASPEYKGEEYKKQALKTVNKVIEKLNKGADFEKLVKEYSEDKFTKDKKGVMEPFGIGKMTPDFENAAFALNKPGEITQKPIETEYGYHVLKLIRKIPIESLEKSRYDLTLRVKNDARETEAKNAYLEKVKKDYKFEAYPEHLTQMLKVVGEDTSKELSPNRYPKLKQKLFDLKGKSYYQADFLEYAQNLVRGNFVGQKENVLRDLYYNYENRMISKLQQEELLSKDQHLAELIEEYKNSILLFDLMDKKVWSKATEDSVGLLAYYNQNKNKYTWDPGFEGSVFYSDNMMALNTMKEDLDKGNSVQDALENVSKQQNYQADIKPSTSRFLFGQFPINEDELKEQKTSTVFKVPGNEEMYGIVYVDKLYPNTELKTLNEAKGFVVADYQDFLEKKWEEDLKKKFPVKINQSELDKLKVQYK